MTSTQLNPEPTADQMQAAWDLLRRADWLPLADIALQARRHALLRGAAQRLARGEGITRTDMGTLANDITAPDARPVGLPNCIERVGLPWPWPPRRTLLGIDIKRAAAGDRDD